MRVTIYIENSEGLEVTVFDEPVKTTDQCNNVNAIMKWALTVELLMTKYVECLEEDP